MTCLIELFIIPYSIRKFTILVRISIVFSILFKEFWSCPNQSILHQNNDNYVARSLFFFDALMESLLFFILIQIHIGVSSL